MIRTLVAGVSLLIAGSTVLAQTDVIAERKGIMRGNGAATRTGTQMIRGEVPFDLANSRRSLPASQQG